MRHKKFIMHEQLKLQKVVRVAICLYLSIVVEPLSEALVTNRFPVNIAMFSASNCNAFFRFRQDDLQRLFELLKFPEFVRFDNRSKMSGEEVYLRGLYELVSGETQHVIAETVFGRDLTAQSRAFTWFIRYIYHNFKHLVHDNLDWWHRNGFFKLSADAIGAKMNLPDGHINYFAHFIDCNCLPTCVTGGGPAEQGANAARWDATIQRAFYNGWKSIHGLKHQTVDNALGMTVDMFGPYSLRRNDLALFRDSDINNRMAMVQVEEDTQYFIFGDSAYKKWSHVSSYVKAEEQIADFMRWNRAMTKVRESIEWNYGYTAACFKYVQNKWKMEVMQAATVSNIYTVATLFRNFHIACYGGQTSNYFNLYLTHEFLEHYINQTVV